MNHGDAGLELHNGKFKDASPTVIGGYVYIGSYDDNLYCLNAITGAKIWNYVTEGALFGSPAVVGSYVYVGDFDNITYCLNAFTGVQVWNYTTDNALWSLPAVAGNYLYIGSQGGYLYCLNAFTGVFIWKYNTGDQMLAHHQLWSEVIYMLEITLTQFIV